MYDLVDLKRREVENSKRRLALVQAALYEKSLPAFAKAAWPIIEGGRECRWNWHHDVICEHLQAVTNGEIKRLLINVPPRTMKSTLINVMYPVWEWISHPELQYLNFSTDTSLAIRDSMRSRRIIESEWFQELFGDRFYLTDDQNQKQWYQNDKTGHRQAIGMTARAMGRGADRILIDDPNSIAEIYSPTERENVINAYEQGVTSRLNDRQTGSIIIVQQRLHEDDLSGHVLRGGEYEHLMLPMLYEGRHPARSIYDPRKKEGEPLWPEHIPLETLEADRRDSYKWAGQYQQRPAPQGGGIIKEDYWSRWTSRELPELDFVFQSYDLSYGETADSDYSARTTWGIFQREEDGEQIDCMILLESWRERLPFPDLLKEAKQAYKDGVYDQAVDLILVEAKASGMSLIQMMRKVGIPAAPFNPGRDNKIARAHSALPWIENGRVWLPYSKKRDMWQSYSQLVVDQCNAFPNGSTDDIVDTVTQAIIYAKSNKLIRHSEEFDPDYERPAPRVSAYG